MRFERLDSMAARSFQVVWKPTLRQLRRKYAVLCMRVICSEGGKGKLTFQHVPGHLPQRIDEQEKRLKGM